VCDTEGLEVDLVERELPMRGGRVLYFLAETHPFITGRECTDQLLSTLSTLGFSEKERIEICVFYSRDQGCDGQVYQLSRNRKIRAYENRVVRYEAHAARIHRDQQTLLHFGG